MAFWWPFAIPLITVLLAWKPYKVNRHKLIRKKKRERFRRTRKILKTDYDRLVQKGLRYYSDYRLKDFKLLGRAGWIFNKPREIGSIEIEFKEAHNPQEYQKAIRRMCSFWPPGKGGITLQRYSEAISEYDQPTLWSEGTDTYRLVEVELRDEQLKLSYELGKYHDATDTQEAFGFVSGAGASLDRYLPRDPFDFRARCASTAICTLTLIDSDPPQFIYHCRSSTAVHQGVGQFHIVPAGEFEPAVVDPRVNTDFDFWINIQREYAEEFLNLPDGLNEPLLDRPDQDHPSLRLLAELQGSGDLTLWEYGLGLNPVSLKPEILVIAVLSPLAGKRILGDQLLDHEGTKRIRDFDYEELLHLIESPKTNPAAHALFKLAWRDRHRLLSNAPQ
ncbi:hypothetical protein J2S62_002223 [Enteractinococcus fodinae]|uniref:Uncharacterized protein n=1 Tax=Enteractinococcus fodinae TaxID=684663 RepID=A0ABU2B3J6_9MICC|nr:hypothetical protein [Enteractinococcus fodinae]